MYKNRIGIMQGRLLPRYNGRYQAFPPGNWKEEFQIAKSMGFDCIEFIYDFENYDESPLITERGIKEIEEIADLTGVRVFSVCADFFMSNPLFSDNEAKRRNNISHLKNLIEKSSRIGVEDITVPFVDDSSLKSDKDRESACRSLQEILPAAEHHGISINLEADLPPQAFCQFIKELNHPMIKVNYDIGNSASLGYDPEEELAAYGAHVSVLHVKDRVRGGGSVKLGTGDADFAAVFRNLKKLGFKGIIIMQAARAEVCSDDKELVEEQLAFLKACLDGWFT